MHCEVRSFLRHSIKKSTIEREKREGIMFLFESQTEFLEYIRTMEAKQKECPLTEALNLISGK